MHAKVTQNYPELLARQTNFIIAQTQQDSYHISI